MLETRRGYADVDDITRFVAAEKVDNARRFFERQSAQKQIVNQTEDARVKPNPDRKCDNGER